MRYQIEEGMDVYGTDGKKVGEVAKVVVGGGSREPRFFVVEKGFLFKDDYMVPREAIKQVDERGVHVAATKDQVERMPVYHGGAPSEAEARQAYEVLGARSREEGRYEFDRFPFGGERGGSAPEGAYIVTVEEYLILTPEERESQGFRSEWDHSRGGSRDAGHRDRL